jgi:hypothetical protein
MLGWRGPCAHGKHAIRKNALCVASAPWSVIILTGRNRHRMA